MAGARVDRRYLTIGDTVRANKFCRRPWWATHLLTVNAGTVGKVIGETTNPRGKVLVRFSGAEIWAHRSAFDLVLPLRRTDP